MRLARRLVFATPFVVVSCTRQAKPEPEHAEDEAVTAPADELPPPLQVKPVPREPDPPRWMIETVVDVLPPLGNIYTAEQNCMQPHVYCNPPPPWPKTKPRPVVAVKTYVDRMKPEGRITRVRLDRTGGADTSWRAVFLARDGSELSGGECKLVEWRYSVLECIVELPPAKLGDARGMFEVRLVPPQSLVEQVERERAAWGDDVGAQRARVIDVVITGANTEVTVGAGTNQGIARVWVGVFLDGNGKPHPDGRCTIARISERKLVCMTKLTPDQIKQNPYVRLEPPGTTKP